MTREINYEVKWQKMESEPPEIPHIFSVASYFNLSRCVNKPRVGAGTRRGGGRGGN